jgi:hypothetical protein
MILMPSSIRTSGETELMPDELKVPSAIADSLLCPLSVASPLPTPQDSMDKLEVTPTTEGSESPSTASNVSFLFLGRDGAHHGTTSYSFQSLCLNLNHPIIVTADYSSSLIPILIHFRASPTRPLGILPHHRYLLHHRLVVNQTVRKFHQAD